jgi:hypothetical protein
MYLSEVLTKASAVTPPLMGDEAVEVAVTESSDALEKLENRACGAAYFLSGASGRRFTDLTLPSGTFIYSGSFNPLHAGHTELVAAAVKLCLRMGLLAATASPLVVFEMSAANADKPPTARPELLRRIGQFVPDTAVIREARLSNFAACITNAPFFVDKARLFPGASFVIGADTLTRLLSVKYYGGSAEALLHALSTIQGLGCRFIVGGRKSEHGFVTAESVLRTVPLLDEVRAMFLPLSEEDFRADVSSTEIRNRCSA